MNIRKRSWLVMFTLLGILYFLSSIPSLRVLPVLRQLNTLLKYFDVSITNLAAKIAAGLPSQLAPAKTVSEDFFAYAKRNPLILEFLLRKAAHVFVFFVITLALFLLVRHYFREPWQAVGSAFIGGTIFAFLDEFHQGLVVGRHGSYIDVGIDMIGVITATLLLIFSFWLTNQYRDQRYR
ncbi:MAG: VanZ family protein [Firmicutes bacterium]|nr:VanZ family protein [Bacillota bacterium]